MKSIIREALILFAITAVAGVLLAVVNEVTKEPIEQQKVLAVENACREVFPEAENFVPMELPADADAALLADYPKDSVEAVYSAEDADGNALGVVLNMCSKEGYGGTIRFGMGISEDGGLKGVSILETSETPGLGLQAADVLAPQFKDRKAESFVYVKGGGASAENEVDAISSATITTKAFVNGVNAGLEFYRENYSK
ncbi:MAG: RnfABCDGE type electron transport complex subunit G [Lachnospiraceae bacterium]|nr:RnfABCDGE type electron transport complex subunit G [Lachnospiraceae bacterium]